jgi:hypothetical protein
LNNQLSVTSPTEPDNFIYNHVFFFHLKCSDSTPHIQYEQNPHELHKLCRPQNIQEIEIMTNATPFNDTSTKTGHSSRQPRKDAM